MVGFAFEDDVTAIGRPGWKVVAPGVVGQLRPALAGDVHDLSLIHISANDIAAVFITANFDNGDGNHSERIGRHPAGRDR